MIFDAVCVAMTSYDTDVKAEVTYKSYHAKGWCETSKAAMELVKAFADDDESKKIAEAYCVECTATTDHCNSATNVATELRAGGLLTAILASAATLLSVCN